MIYILYCIRGFDKCKEMRSADTKDAKYTLAIKENNQTYSYFKATLILKFKVIYQ